MRRFGVTLRNLGNSIFLIDFVQHSEEKVARFTFSRGWAHLAKPRIENQTVVASGFGAQADKGVFLIGPTGLALGKDDKLYVSDALGNRISEIWEATTRTTSAGIGRTLTHDGLLLRPLAMTNVPNGHLLVVNGSNGKVVEIDPETGTQIYAQWIDNNKAQTPPGNGDLFGIAMNLEGTAFYYVEDEVNMLVIAK